MGRIKAVLDTNVIVRGIAARNPSSASCRVYEKSKKSTFDVVSSPYLLGEVRDTLLSGKPLYGLTDDEVRRMIEKLRKTFHVVPGNLTVSRQIVPEDLRDNPLFEAALEGDAGYVVSEDLAVLNVKSLSISGSKKIEVLAPGPFLRTVIS